MLNIPHLEAFRRDRVVPFSIREGIKDGPLDLDRIHVEGRFQGGAAGPGAGGRFVDGGRKSRHHLAQQKELLSRKKAEAL